MDEAQTTTTMLERLATLGVRLAIDDFGTGYSSLAYLRRFPIDHLKVDRSFIGDAADDHEDTILEAVVQLGHALKLRVTAEGVETADACPAPVPWLRQRSGIPFRTAALRREAAAYVAAHAASPSSHLRSSPERTEGGSDHESPPRGLLPVTAVSRRRASLAVEALSGRRHRDD